MSGPGEDHHYATELAWRGSTADGYDDYARAHEVAAPPARSALDLSSDPAFQGDATRLNPEQLVVAAASSCQLLSFLAVASRARLNVVSYTDAATAVMEASARPRSITRIELRPRVVLADTDRPRRGDDWLHHLSEVAHRECFIANSLRTEVTVSPRFEWTGPDERSIGPTGQAS